MLFFWFLPLCLYFLLGLPYKEVKEMSHMSKDEVEEIIKVTATRFAPPDWLADALQSEKRSRHGKAACSECGSESCKGECKHACGAAGECSHGGAAGCGHAGCPHRTTQKSDGAPSECPHAKAAAKSSET